MTSTGLGNLARINKLKAAAPNRAEFEQLVGLAQNSGLRGRRQRPASRICVPNTDSSWCGIRFHRSVNATIYRSVHCSVS